MARKGRALATVILLLTVLVSGAGRAGAPPPLPLNDGGRILALTSPELTPGSSGPLQVELSNPLKAAWTQTDLTFQVYGYSGPDGNGSTVPGDAWAATLSLPSGATGSEANLTLTSLAPGASQSWTLTVHAPATSPSTTYLIRDQLTFVANGSAYVLESRGYFSNALWAAASVATNGTPTLNLTLLGVSGVTPETAVPVSSTTLAPWIWGILAVALILAGVGGYAAMRAPRRSSGSSRSGTEEGPRRKTAETADGTNLTSDGD